MAMPDFQGRALCVALMPEPSAQATAPSAPAPAAQTDEVRNLSGIRTTEATTDQLIELAGALEQRRGLAIVDAVAVLSAGYQDGAFKAGFETACEEITLRLRTEVWDHCLPPVDAPKPAFHTQPPKETP